MMIVALSCRKSCLYTCVVHSLGPTWLTSFLSLEYIPLWTGMNERLGIILLLLTCSKLLPQRFQPTSTLPTTRHDRSQTLEASTVS